MSWANIRELLLQERKLLDPGVIPEFPHENAFETQHSALLTWYLRTKADVDSAVNEFAQTLEWPELNPMEKFFIGARIDFAWEIVSIMNTTRDGERLIAYPSADTCPTADLLKWLLIEIWPYGCGRFLQRHKWIAEQSVATRSPANKRVVELEPAKCVA